MQLRISDFAPIAGLNLNFLIPGAVCAVLVGLVGNILGSLPLS